MKNAVINFQGKLASDCTLITPESILSDPSLFLVHLFTYYTKYHPVSLN